MESSASSLQAIHTVTYSFVVMADAFGAISTPHIFMLDSGRMLRYKGRIDDSRDPTKATYSDLEHALEDILAHRTVRVPETKPFGCAIVR